MKAKKASRHDWGQKLRNWWNWKKAMVGMLVLVLTLAVIFGWDPLDVLHPQPPLRIVAVADRPTYIISEEVLAELEEHQAIFLKSEEDGNWVCMLKDGSQVSISPDSQAVPPEKRAPLHPGAIVREGLNGWAPCALTE